jgi:N,N'-diacetyllegionaminate synthase
MIAEAGVNHNGRIENAYRLIDAAKEAGADIVKFQFFDSKKLWGDDRIKHLELRFGDFEDIADYCKETGIEFCCTPFGVAELLMLVPLLKRVKVASGMTQRQPFMEAVRDTHLPVLLSTGMSTTDDIRRSLTFLDYPENVTIMQCTSSYPCRMEDVNLRVLTDWYYTLNWKNIGLSDHTTSITVPIAAAALGVGVIEKHFTLDRNDEGPDHKASITPREFKAMRLAIIEIEAAMGSSYKRVMASEEVLRRQWRK